MVHLELDFGIAGLYIKRALNSDGKPVKGFGYKKNYIEYFISHAQNKGMTEVIGEKGFIISGVNKKELVSYMDGYFKWFPDLKTPYTEFINKNFKFSK